MGTTIIFVAVEVLRAEKMVNVYIVDIVVVTPARVEVELFIPDMSVRKLLLSCHGVYAAYEVVDQLGWSRYKEMLMAWLSRNPNPRRRILVAKAIRNGVRPQPLSDRYQPSFWASVVAKDKVVERTRYEKSVVHNRYARVVREIEERGYVDDDEESVDSDRSSDWSSDWSSDVMDYIAANFPYEKYFGCGK